MKCPKCHARTEVLETRQRVDRTHRRRRCLGPHCQYRFTTNESNTVFIPPAAPVPVTDDALAAALAVDARRALISREQRAKRRAERDTWYDSGFDSAPTTLTEESAMKEIRGY